MGSLIPPSLGQGIEKELGIRLSLAIFNPTEALEVKGTMTPTVPMKHPLK